MAKKARPNGWIDVVQTRIAEMPARARPPFYGLFFVYMLVGYRAILLLPVTLILLLTAGPQGILQIVWLLIVAGLGGFAAGAVYSAAQFALGWAGRVGALATGWVTVLTYFMIVLPSLSPDDPHSRSYFNLHEGDTWFALVVCSLLFGSIIGIGLDQRSRQRQKAGPRSVAMSQDNRLDRRGS